MMVRGQEVEMQLSKLSLMNDQRGNGVASQGNFEAAKFWHVTSKNKLWRSNVEEDIDSDHPRSTMTVTGIRNVTVSQVRMKTN